jgi:hypothetical protein
MTGVERGLTAVTFLLLPFLVLAVVGLALSLVAHVAALLGQPQPLGGLAWGLHLGIFVVWVPTVLVGNRLVADFKRKDFWKAALRGCPRWLRRLTYGFFVYAVVNFLLFAFDAPQRPAGAGANAPPAVFRGFSGHWMAFYAAATAVLYSAIVVSGSDPARRCPNGHPVSPAARYCESCGEAVPEEEAAAPGDG